MIAPAESSPWMVRKAPRPSTADCRNIRSTRENAPNVPLMSFVRVCSSRCSSLARSNRFTARLGEAHRLQDVGVAGIGIGDGIALDAPCVSTLRAPRQQFGGIAKSVSTKAPANVRPPSQG